MQIRTSLDILLLFKFFEVFGGETDRLASRESKVGGSWYEFSISTLDHTSRARAYRGARRDSWATVLGATGAARACRAVLEWETWMSTRTLALWTKAIASYSHYVTASSCCSRKWNRGRYSVWSPDTSDSYRTEGTCKCKNTKSLSIFCPFL